ncbi:MAG: metallophosphoesterase family protein [Candidatus Omnitrophica bacterium]|nr:metallophosphoesterase family protein [Candidatus Omnitrophota bacterium]
MRIGVLSDTHSKILPSVMIEDFKTVDLIIHAGDICTLDDLKVLQPLAKLEGVQGNMDDAGVKNMFPRKKILRCGKKLIGVYHGEGPSKRVLDFVKKEFADDKVDVVVFGHSHCPCQEKINGVLYFNPGSPTDQVCAPYCSYGILDIEDDQVTGRIIKIEE